MFRKRYLREAILPSMTSTGTQENCFRARSEHVSHYFWRVTLRKMFEWRLFSYHCKLNFNIKKMSKLKSVSSLFSYSFLYLVSYDSFVLSFFLFFFLSFLIICKIINLHCSHGATKGMTSSKVTFQTNHVLN